MNEFMHILKSYNLEEGQAIDRHHLLSKVITLPDIHIQHKYQALCLPIERKSKQ